tara:strand:- start:1024 stop:2040 length:1017 start_codon:yes stop_codon:yes gene_type:complete
MLSAPANIPILAIDRPEQLTQALLHSETPWVARGLISRWPLVQAAQRSDLDALQYLNGFYAQKPVTAFLGEADINGRFFYNDAMDGFNFIQLQTSLNQITDKLLALRSEEKPPCLYVGSTSIDTWLPGMRQSNDLDQLAPLSPLVSLWLGNRSRIAAHFDYPRNLACCVLGKRRFTVFPPEQVANLYIGPWDLTPAGQPISLVDFHNPDLKQFPRFKDAWAAAQVADLSPGDVLYMPGMWWHQVESTAAINGLVNYWWSESPAIYGNPNDAFNHALLSIKSLPEAQKAAWRAFFDHYIFADAQNATAHIPLAQQGRLGEIDDIGARRLRADLQNRLKR